MPDIIIVGSGAAGVAAALALARLGIRPLMLDVGRTASGAGPVVAGNLYDYRKQHDSFDLFIGDDLAGVSDVLRDEVGVAKLNAPNMAFITQDAGTLGPVEAVDFDPIQSFALGGLGNGWGSGLYRFTDADLAGFPHPRGRPGAPLRGAHGRDRHQRRGRRPDAALRSNGRPAAAAAAVVQRGQSLPGLPAETGRAAPRRRHHRAAAARRAVRGPGRPHGMRLQQHRVLAGRALPLYTGRHAEKADRGRTGGVSARRSGAVVDRERRGRDRYGDRSALGRAGRVHGRRRSCWPRARSTPARSSCAATPTT